MPVIMRSPCSPDIMRAWNFFYGRTLPRREIAEEDLAGMPTVYRKLEPVEPGGELYPMNTPLRELGDFGLGVGFYFSSRVAMMIMFAMIGCLNAFTIMAYYRSSAYATGKEDMSYDMRTSAVCHNEMTVCLDKECYQKAARSDCPMLCFEDGFVDMISTGILLAYLILVTISQQHIADSVDIREQTSKDYSIVVEDPSRLASDPEEWRCYFSPYGHVTYVSIGVANGRMLKLLALKRSLMMQLFKAEEETRTEAARARKKNGASEEEGSAFARARKNFVTSARASLSFYMPVKQDVDDDDDIDDNDKGEIDGANGRTTGEDSGGRGGDEGKEGTEISSKYEKRSVQTHSRRKSREDWAIEDEKNLDQKVAAMAAGTGGWNDDEKALAQAEQELRAKNSRAKQMLALQVLGFCRDASYYRYRLRQVDETLASVRSRGAPNVAKVFVTFETEDGQRAALGALKLGSVSALLNTNMPYEDRFRFKTVLSIDEAPEPREIVWTELNTNHITMVISLLEGVFASVAFILIAWGLIKVVIDVPVLVGLAVGGLNMAVAPVMIAITKRERHLTRTSQHCWLLLKLVITRWSMSVILVRHLIPFDETLDLLRLQTIRNILLVDAFLKPVLQAVDVPGLIDHYVRAPFAKSQDKMNRLFLGAPWSLAERYSDMSKSIFIALSFATIYPYAYFICAAANLLSFLSDKYCLFRVWKPAEPEDARLTSFHRSTLAIAFLFHCLYTLWYFADWPFDLLCPTRETVPDWVVGTLDFELKDQQVYKECDMEHKGLLWDVHGDKKHMTSSQKSLIAIYKIGTIAAILVIFIAYFGRGFKKLYKNLFVGHMHSTLPISDINFSEVDFIEGYIPGLTDPFFLKPLLACNLKHLDTNHIHWEGNWQAYNLHSSTDFPEGISEEDRSDFFGKVVHYPPEGGEPALSYHEYMQEKHPGVFERRAIHKQSDGDEESPASREARPPGMDNGDDAE